MTTQTEALPTGTVTFFFSDVQDSTGLLQRMASGYKDVLERHATIIRECLSSNAGMEIFTEGDSFFADLEWYEDTVCFCAEYDQSSFDPAYRADPLASFESILVRTTFANQLLETL